MPQSQSEERRQAWEEKIRNQRDSGLSITRWCRENQIATQTFYAWRAKLYPKPALGRHHFTELTDTKSMGIIVEYKDTRIHLNKDFDSAIFKQCLTLLREMQ